MNKLATQSLRGLEMKANSCGSISSTSWLASLAGTIPFLIWGLVLIGGELPHEWAIPSWLHIFVRVLFVCTIALPPIGLFFGWIKGFPRWSYPYAGHVLVFSLYMMNVATPGFLFGRELWGWRAWVPFAVVATAALLVTRSLRPLMKFFTNIWNDWTLLTFGMFGFMPLLVAIGFDEVDRFYSLNFMIILALLMSSMALLYMRARQQWYRVLALVIGILSATIITAVAPTLYWQQHGWVHLQQVALVGVAVVLIMFAPVLIGLSHRAIVMRQAG